MYLNVAFHLIQYIQNSVLLTYNQYRKLLRQFTFFVCTKSLKFSVYLTLIAHFNLN